MKIVKHLGLFILLVLFISACNSSPVAPEKRFTPFPEEIKMLELTNAARAESRTCGTAQFPAVPAVTWVETILDTAWFHSVDMAAANTEAHVGASTLERLSARGYEADIAFEARKRTALPAVPEDAFNVWLADAEACANIMNANVTNMGVGLHRVASGSFWTMILTTPKGTTPPPPAASLTLSPTTANVTVGNTTAVTFSATLTNATDTISWALTGAGSLSTTTGASTSYTAPATGDAGTATLTATAGALSATATITIVAATPGLTVTPATATATVNGPDIIFKASSNQITWSMSGPGTFSWVGETFTFKPGGPGTTVITASAVTGGETATATVTTVDLKVSPSTAAVEIGGASVDFAATLAGSTETISWSLTGPGTISTNTGPTTSYTPPVTGEAGTATLTATAGDATATATITISVAVPSLTVTPTTATVSVAGTAVAFSATLANSAEQISWSLVGPGSISSTTGPATSYTPPATGTAGTATLTATAGALTATAAITIEQSYQEAFLALINAFRAEPQTCAGEAMPAVPPVSLNTPLHNAARLHSQDMADNNYFSHTGLNGSTFTTRSQAQGYAGFAAGENIAAGSATAQGSFDQWRGSTSGHCQFMMSAAIDEIGIGYGQNATSTFTHYWTLKGGKK